MAGMNEKTDRMTWRFPFGKPVQLVKQTDCSPKHVFVLGVYASAVHAKWLNPQGEKVVEALAVASEPYIFWRGEDAEKYLPSIPAKLGKLIPANRALNGPSGRALDEKIIAPLGYSRTECWLCDLVPHSCVNTRQRDAIARAYHPRIEEFGLNRHSVPRVPGNLTSPQRRQEIYEELLQSKATKLILLGDMPIQWFLHAYADKWSRLSDFVQADGSGYGEAVETKIGDVALELIPLAHPRQIAQLGASSGEWFERHEKWMGRQASR